MGFTNLKDEILEIGKPIKKPTRISIQGEHRMLGFLPQCCGFDKLDCLSYRSRRSPALRGSGAIGFTSVVVDRGGCLARANLWMVNFAAEFCRQRHAAEGDQSDACDDRKGKC